MRNLFFVQLIVLILAASCNAPVGLISLRTAVELNMGESGEITLSNGDKVNLTLLEIQEVRDTLCHAIRELKVKINVDGEDIVLGSGNYHLPVEIGRVQIDCPVVKNYYSNSTSDHWGLTKDARFRLWPKGSSFMEPGTFVYPVKQHWLASMSQSGNEPCYVDWGEDPEKESIYYHAGHDIGGAEGLDEIISATDGLVISALRDTLAGYDDFPSDIRTDVVWILTDMGWYIRYSHLDSTDPAIRTGARVSMGQKIGLMGKQGHSGGWVHLHFEMKHRETTSGAWGTEDAYAYLWESYVSQYSPDVIAVARPHQLLWTGQETILDGSKSTSFRGDLVDYEWIFTDGTTANGATQVRSYSKPGEYSEILKVTDSKGNVDYDFMVVQVYDRDHPGQTIPVMQTAFHPSLEIRPNDQVTFLVRTFNTEVGSEIWDFGDGSPQVRTKSEAPDRQNSAEGKFAETIHSFAEPGDYIVKVERLDELGFKAIVHLHVHVNE